MQPRCPDCLAEGVASARTTDGQHAAKRCATHHRAVVKARKAAQHERHVTKTYGLEPGDYDRLYASQNGVCAVCGPWSGRSGKTKKLAVDHCHATGEVRMLACSDCNRTIGRYRDNADIFRRFAECLENPPARKVLGND